MKYSYFFKFFYIKKKQINLFKNKKKSSETYQSFTDIEKKCNNNLPKEQKKKVAEYRRNYYLTHNK